jgi:hypothetical protein
MTREEIDKLIDEIDKEAIRLGLSEDPYADYHTEAHYEEDSESGFVIVGDNTGEYERLEIDELPAFINRLKAIPTPAEGEEKEGCWDFWDTLCNLVSENLKKERGN